MSEHMIQSMSHPMSSTDTTDVALRATTLALLMVFWVLVAPMHLLLASIALLVGAWHFGLRAGRSVLTVLNVSLVGLACSFAAWTAVSVAGV